MYVWVLGAEGLVGSALCARLTRRAIPYIGTGKGTVDATCFDSVARFIKKEKPTHIINAAAYTDVDKAETNEKIAYLVNAHAPEYLGKCANDLGIRLLHISSDYVFGSHYDRPCTETDTCAPIGVYAQSKYEGEQRLQSSCPHACIVRTSWVFGGSGKNFLSSCLRRLRVEKTIHVDSRQKGRPTFVKDLAEALLCLCEKEGIFHFANEGICTRYDFAKTLSHTASLTHTQLIPCEAMHSALRPSYSVLDTAKISSLIQPRPWQETLTEMCS